MNRTIKARRIRDKRACKTALFYADNGDLIPFEEKSTQDSVEVKFGYEDPQYALYSEEYLPDTLSHENHKKADITALIVDEGNRKLKYFIADVKSNIQGEDMIFKLCEQWIYSLRYLKFTIIFELQEFEEEEHILIITRKFDEEKISNMITRREANIRELTANYGKGIAASKMLLSKLKLEKEYELLMRFINKEFLYSDKFTSEEIHNFEICLMEYDVDSEKYKYTLDVAM